MLGLTLRLTTIFGLIGALSRGIGSYVFELGLEEGVIDVLRVVACGPCSAPRHNSCSWVNEGNGSNRLKVMPKRY